MTLHSERARLALAHLAEADPALAALALWCEHRDGEGPTRSAGETIFYGPEFPLRPLPEQVGLAGHHVLHVALRHSARMGGMATRLGPDFDADRFNLAADALVNEAMLAAGHALPRPCVRLTEVQAALLGADRESPEEALARWDVERLYMALQRAALGEAGRAAEAGHMQARGYASDLDPQDGTTGEDGEAAEWQGHLARAMETGRRAGRGIGRLSGRLADLPAPRVPWELHLRRLVARAVARHPRPTHRRPARSWLAMEAEARRRGGPLPAFQPGLAATGMRPRIAVGLDSSGSVDDTRLALFAAEIAGIARRSGAETHLLAFDEAVHDTRRLEPSTTAAALATRPLRRGGGTSFVAVLETAQALGASVAVILTDLDGEFGPAPRLPVIWAVPAEEAPPPPPFGRMIQMQG